MKFKIWLESQVSVLEIANVYGYTSGTHAFTDGGEETPASNPWRVAKWEYDLKNTKSWELLVGKTIVIFDKSWGSYHERCLNLKIGVEVDSQMEFQLEELGESLYSLHNIHYDINNKTERWKSKIRRR